MDPKFQTSFIPKGPVTSPGQVNFADRHKGQGLLGFLATLIFIISVVGALGIFGYNLYLTSQISQMGTDLATAKASLDPATITEISRLDSRIVSTQTLLGKHTILSPFFDFLEENTLKSLRWTSFNFSTTKDGLILNMQGQAHGYSALALQAEAFNKSKYIKSPLFSDLTLDDKGNVTFAFTATLDPSVISYKASLTNIPTTVPVAVPTTSTSTAGTASSTIKQ